MKKLFLSSCVIFVFAISCKNRSFEFSQIQWLAGNWQNITDSTQFYENWEKINDSLFSGEAFVIANNDTVFSEKISIEKNGENIFYNATVSDQNDGKTISFKLVSFSKSQIVFENKEHDFPSKIFYKEVSDDLLSVKIEGKQKGRNHFEYFSFERRNVEKTSP